MNRLADKVVAVTDGASGIGEATVRRFVEEVARVAFADRDAVRGKRVETKLDARKAVACFVEADMRKEADATGFVEAAVARFGRIRRRVLHHGTCLFIDGDGIVSEAIVLPWPSHARRHPQKLS